jgi:hypothetical protein
VQRAGLQQLLERRRRLALPRFYPGVEPFQFATGLLRDRDHLTAFQVEGVIHALRPEIEGKGEFVEVNVKVTHGFLIGGCQILYPLCIRASQRLALRQYPGTRRSSRWPWKREGRDLRRS